MKNLIEYINESRLSELANKNAEQFIQKYTDNRRSSALEFKNNAEKDGWELDFDYDKWTTGDSITLLFRRKKEKLYVEYVLGRNSSYDGNLTEEALSSFKVIEDAEYYKN